MRILKYVFVVITALMIIYMVQPTAHAADTVTVKSFDDMRKAISTWTGHGEQGANNEINTDDMKPIVTPIINILTAMGIFVIVAVTIVMGIKYMFATPEQAAKLKQQLIGLVVSAVVVLGATAIWKMVYTVLSQTSL